MGLFPLALSCVLLLLTGLSGEAEAYSYLVSVDATALDFGDSNYTEQSTYEEDGRTALMAAVGPVTGSRFSYFVGGASGNVVESRASADLATGQLTGFVNATMNSGDPSNIPAVGGSYAEFRDFITFHVPEGMTSAQVSVSLSIDGTITNAEGLVGPYGCDNVNGSDIGGYLYLGGTTASTDSVHPCGLLSTVLPSPPASLPFELSVEKEVTDGERFLLISRLYLALSNNELWETVEFDFSGTASLGIDLTPGAAWTSDSEVLLTIPEPTSTLLLVVGLTGLAAAGRWRLRP
jgi:hypothetical protein